MLAINIIHIRYFVSVYETGSMTKAGKQCNVVMKSVSQSILKMESVLGEKLFERVFNSKSGDFCKTTEFAEKIYFTCKVIMMAMESLESISKEKNKNISLTDKFFEQCQTKV